MDQSKPSRDAIKRELDHRLGRLSEIADQLLVRREEVSEILKVFEDDFGLDIYDDRHDVSENLMAPIVLLNQVIEKVKAIEIDSL